MKVFWIGFFLLSFIISSYQGGKPWAEARAVEVESRFVIDRVDVTGVKSFSAAAIENTLELGPGDRLERGKLLRTEENLQALYVRHGYEEVSIRSRLVRKKNESGSLETVLEFAITEGRPVRIASIRFVLVGQEMGQKVWKKVEERDFRAKLGLSVGDIYDQDKLVEGKRKIQEILASAQYIGSKVDHERALIDQPKDDHTANWVSIELRVDIGEKVNFGFRGNTFFTKAYLDSLVDEQRLLGLGKDYVGAIRSKLEEEYHSSGFARVEIVPYTFEEPKRSERKVTYAIQEGPRVKIESVDFDGNIVFSDEELRRRFFAKANSLVQNGIYVEKEVQKAMDLLVEWLKEKGYLVARVAAINTIYPPKPRTQQQNSSVRLSVYLYEGDQTIVNHISIQGGNVFSASKIQGFLQVRRGDPLNLFALSEGVDALKKAYRDEGYLGFRIVNEGTHSLIEYSQENRYANLTLNLEEGPQYRVSQIEVEGLSYTHENIVRRELRIRPGATLRENDLIESERNLRRLGIFSSVSIKPLDDPADPGLKIVRITLGEADRGVLTFGPGFRNDLGIRLFGQLAYSNLWGDNHTLSVNAAANRRFYNYHFTEGQASVSYSWPWFGFSELSFRPTVAIGQTQYNQFDARNLTVAANWDRQISASPNITGYFSYVLEKIIQSGAEKAVDNAGYQIASITPKIAVDLRDNPLAPTRGYFGTAWLDLALPLIGSQGDPDPIGYYKVQMRNDYYLPVLGDIGFFLSFRMGYEQPFANDTGKPQYFIPLIKEFALGGVGSLRGYQEQEKNNPFRLTGQSLSYVNYRAQLEFPFSGALKFGLFLDAGNLLVGNFSLGGLNYGTGFGFHYVTPVGPVNFDMGFRVDPPPNTDPYIIHFSVGII